MTRREFTLASEYRYNRSSPLRWIASHTRPYFYLLLAMVVGDVLNNALFSWSRVLAGQAFDWLSRPAPLLRDLGLIALLLVVSRLAAGLAGLFRNVSVELLAQRVERDSRDELYTNLLGKSQTFHGRQRVGDLMARATNDVHQLNLMFSPGVNLIFDSAMAVVVPIVSIGLLRAELLLVPLIYVGLFVVAVWQYNRQLIPVSDALRDDFGRLNAGLQEAVAGVEVVKSNAQELQEQAKFSKNARRYRDVFVRRGEIEARYLPLLIYGAIFAGGLLHALLLYRQGLITIGDIVAFMGLLGILRFPTFLSIFTFQLVQEGLASAARILDILKTETELSENEAGFSGQVRGHVVFEHVSFGYDADNPVLQDVSFEAQPGETVAIVGQTGSGKSTLTKLINRVYDVTEGRVLVDGVDVRDWSMESLRSQINIIEQDIFLFSRAVAENIAFSSGQRATQEQIEWAARQAQADAFIRELPEGYRTEIGERGVTLSGGQRQRLAIARAFLTDPRILVLDDSTSAIDSATEDEIQRAMRRVQQGRTTFIITHRLSQIRWADRILVLRRGRLIDQGTHEELLARSADYRRIFARYEGEAWASS